MQTAGNVDCALPKEQGLKHFDRYAKLTTLSGTRSARVQITQQTNDEAIAEIWQLFRETTAAFKETDARLDQRFSETDARLDQRFAETNAEVARTNANLQKLEGLFGNQWGRLIEALVQPSVLNLFQKRNHNVRRLHQRSKAQVNGSTMEIDLILEDGDEVIPIDVKTTLTVEAVDDFLTDLADFTRFFPSYTNHRIYGGVAGLEVPQDVGRYAYRKGLFVLKITGDDLVQIMNDEGFQPRDFGPSAH
ncbi:MAG: hypothetical protein HC802_12690 [Caldilineaceae bacterium]|nr:hypothetical protein [Caldilineaceae bacterium]